MTTQDTASYDGLDLRAVRHYDWPQPHSEEFHLRTVQFDSAESQYWCAIAGKVYSLAVIKGSTCIANVQDMMLCALSVDRDRSYVIWTPKDKSQSCFNRWCKKWTKRTA